MLDKIINIYDAEHYAKSILKTDIYDFFAGGSYDEITMRDNVTAFNQLSLLPNIFLNSHQFIDTSTDILGLKLSLPLIIAPIAFHELAHNKCEIATARAGKKNGTIAIISTMSSLEPKRIKNSVKSDLWFQLYMFKNRSQTIELVKWIEQLKYKVIVLTADMPIMGKRERDIRNQFQLPNIFLKRKFFNRNLMRNTAVKIFTDNVFNSDLSWQDVTWLKSITNLPLVLKGIMRADDAKKAINYGISAIIVSNHGGRQLDTMPSTLEVLPEIVEAVAGRIPIIFDGGIRRGSHIFKAIALGAHCVLLGRPAIWGLACAGQKGVEHVINILHKELYETMKLCGFNTIKDINQYGKSIVQRKQ